MSSIASIRISMGWVDPSNREKCANCKWVREDNPSSGRTFPTWYCTKGNFLTPANATCHNWTLQK
ncbi:hypothetical protein SFMTTN_2059 [Sulfuriferula multivorans]|uniref:Uncharacterized protein n=1 Tax=Sulfuriferula multivorans TaxID=1559896 RepID=A0A401JF59_9PROT|nr:hypothetical protein [Sulfuriferula multivorans]GBL46246.1 hypothetical protein SFMTTN_2059 [Sulfuriferula multivorans]